MDKGTKNLTDLKQQYRCDMVPVTLNPSILRAKIYTSLQSRDIVQKVIVRWGHFA